MAIMKILVATGLYAPEIGGPATHIDVLEREFPKQGIDVLVHPFGKVRSYPKIVRHIVYFFGLLRRMRNVSVVYALDPVSVGLPAMITYVPLLRRWISRIPRRFKSSSIGLPKVGMPTGLPLLNHASKFWIGAITAFVLVAVGTSGARIPT